MEISAVIRDVRTGKEALIMFPTDEYDIKQRLGLGKDDDFEYLVSDSTSNLVREQDSIDLINRFAEKVETVDEALVEAVVEVIGGNAKLFVEEDFDFDSVSLLADVTTEQELGYHYVDEVGFASLDKDTLETYFDYEAYGRDIAIGARGGFSSHGFVEVS